MSLENPGNWVGGNLNKGGTEGKKDFRQKRETIREASNEKGSLRSQEKTLKPVFWY